VTSTRANEQPCSADRSPPTLVVSGDGDCLAPAGDLEISTLAQAEIAQAEIVC
jgi:acetyl esterase/lipase